jgi:hypothetical protein
MKKLILLLALAFVMCGCVQKEEDGSLKLNTGLLNESYVVIIDSCEYISYNGGYGLAHKGNCKYCAERRMMEQEELIRRLKED